MKAKEKALAHASSCPFLPVGADPKRHVCEFGPHTASCDLCFEEFTDDSVGETPQRLQSIDPVDEFERVTADPDPNVPPEMVREMIERIVHDMGWAMAEEFCKKNHLLMPDQVAA